MDILNLENNMRTFMIITMCVFFSCYSNNNLDFHLKFIEYVKSNYSKYAQTHEDVKLWIDNSISRNQDNIKEILFTSDFKIDKLLIINKEDSKLVGIVTISYSEIKNCTHDWIFMISGVKLNGEWKFIRGGSLYVPRQNYKYNINEPLNHAELSYIGRDFFLKRFLVFNGDKVTVNSEAINNHVTLEGQFRMANGAFVTNWEEYIEDQNNKIISDKEYNDIIEDLKNQVHEDKVLPKKGTKEWKELYGTKIPLFEREEWKNLRLK